MSEGDPEQGIVNLLALVAAVALWPVFEGVMRFSFGAAVDITRMGGYVFQFGPALIGVALLYLVTSYLLGVFGMVALKRIGLL